MHSLLKTCIFYIFFNLFKIGSDLSRIFKQYTYEGCSEIFEDISETFTLIRLKKNIKTFENSLECTPVEIVNVIFFVYSIIDHPK